MHSCIVLILLMTFTLSLTPLSTKYCPGAFEVLTMVNARYAIREMYLLVVGPPRRQRVFFDFCQW